jgi:hypothetical protein
VEKGGSPQSTIHSARFKLAAPMRALYLHRYSGGFPIQPVEHEDASFLVLNICLGSFVM